MFPNMLCENEIAGCAFSVAKEKLLSRLSAWFREKGLHIFTNISSRT